MLEAASDRGAATMLFMGKISLAIIGASLFWVPLCEAACPRPDEGCIICPDDGKLICSRFSSRIGGPGTFRGEERENQERAARERRERELRARERIERERF
jgi:hypothetical protein